jgi:hypothetical protein
MKFLKLMILSAVCFSSAAMAANTESHELGCSPMNSLYSVQFGWDQATNEVHHLYITHAQGRADVTDYDFRANHVGVVLRSSASGDVMLIADDGSGNSVFVDVKSDVDHGLAGTVMMTVNGTDKSASDHLGVCSGN